jgi:hypothetical protein
VTAWPGQEKRNFYVVCLKRFTDQGSTVDIFLFPHLKSMMKSARFADVAAIQEHVTAVLRSIPREAFADSFQKLCEFANSVL